MTAVADDAKCASCHKDQSQLSLPLKNCAKCSFTSNDNPFTTNPLPNPTETGPRFIINEPFTALANGTWLRGRPEDDVYQLLCDTFRMRREDMYKFQQEAKEGSIYAGGSVITELGNFQRFLEHATQLDAAKADGMKLLPSWWSQTKIKKCLEIAATDPAAMIAFPVTKRSIQSFYQQNLMPMQLRMFGEALDGTLSVGQSGAGMLGLQAQFENGHGLFHTANLEFVS